MYTVAVKCYNQHKAQILGVYKFEGKKKKSQCNYSEKNDFCCKCEASGEPSFNGMEPQSLE